MSAVLSNARRAWRAFGYSHTLAQNAFIGDRGLGRRCISVASTLQDKEDDKGPSDTKQSAALVDSMQDNSIKELLCLHLPRPLIPGGVPRYLRILDQPLLRQLQDVEKLGGQVTVAVFMASSQNKDASSGDSGVEEAVVQKNLTENDLETVGTLALVRSFTFTEESGRLQGQLMVQGFRRVSRIGTVQKSPLKLKCKPLANEPYNPEDPNVKATHMEIVQTMKTIFDKQPLYLEQMRHVRTGDFNDMSRFSDLVVSLVNGGKDDLQEFLADTSVPSKMMKALFILKKELDIIKLQQDISKRVEDKFNTDQKRYFLMEQLKHIQKELGVTKDDKSALAQKFEERFEPYKANAPEEARQVIEEEINKLRMLEPASSEFNVTRNYLDWLTSVPWGMMDKEVYDIQHAQSTLDADHHGLQDVKDRILEFIAVGKLNSTVQGKILCLVGPPGVGKTSIGKSVANSLGRKFFRFSVGGLSDVAEIKGHRRTYVGAMPGKIVQALKQVKSSNPLVLIDEIDKLGRGFQGDPASALLELLDPEQNGSFMDHYLDVPVDLSKVLFVCTANVLDTIPGPLLDRMEVIHISGYTSDEKRSIARQYLEVQARTSTAVPENAVVITDGALDVLIEQYCRESGVRNLKKQLEKIYRKLALLLVNSGEIEMVEVVEEPEASTPDESTASTQPLSADDVFTPQPLTASDNSNISPDASGLPGWVSDAAGSTDESSSETKQPEKVKKMKPLYTGEPAVITEENIDSYLGKPPFNSDRFYDTTPIGVVMGLAWTSMGGSTLYIESNKISSTGDSNLKLTGQLGDVMKESAMIAQTFCRSFFHKLQPDSEFFEKGTVHVHVPQGSTPKDGPSAGCTMVTAMLSLALGKAALTDVAMTGEISLSGRMLPIGGVKEKTLAGKRSGVKTIIFPESNRRDWDELSPELRAGLDAHFVGHYIDIFKLVFPELALEKAQQVASIEAELVGVRGSITT